MRAGASARWHDFLSTIDSHESIERRWIECLRALYRGMSLVDIASRFLTPWRKLVTERVGLEAIPRVLKIAPADLAGWQALVVALTEADGRGGQSDPLWLHLTDALRSSVGSRWRKDAAPRKTAEKLPGQDHGAAPDRFRETGGMVGSSAVIGELARRCDLAAQDSYPVLILGETGAGKGVAARLIHHLSGCRGRFVALNCAALPEALMESELFGHVRGAFTGARASRDGLFHEARKGTLLLDEISEIPTYQQAKILGALQDGLVRRVGSSKHEQIDLRVIGTSNRDLTELLDRGVLRRDLYYRMAVHEITVPPLREHPEDIPQLAASFLARWQERHRHVSLPVFSPQGFISLREARWPGNIRELEHVVYRLASSHPGESVGAAEVDEVLVRPAEKDKAGTSTSAHQDLLALRLDDAERRAVEKALRLTDGNKTAAARLLGVSRKTIYNKMERYGLR